MKNLKDMQQLSSYYMTLNRTCVSGCINKLRGILITLTTSCLPLQVVIIFCNQLNIHF